ncbi:DUF6087 family protein [Streptomyces sp. NPDC055013]
MTSDSPKGSHLNPDAPRVIPRWNGSAWEPHEFAANLTESQRVLRPRVETLSAYVPTRLSFMS